jgi:MFS family permease
MAKSAVKSEIPVRFMLPLVLGTMLNPLNSTMLATSLVTLCNSFKITTGQGAVLIISLYVTSTIAQPLMGRLADRFSAKRINTLGFILIMIASLIGAFAPAFWWLIVSRILLGLGTSAAYPSAMTLINQKYAAEGRTVPGIVLGVVGVTSQVSMVLGPLLGGFLTQLFGWRGIFFINIPWVVVAMVLSGIIPNYPPIKKSEGSLWEKLDGFGIIFFTVFLLALLNLIMQPHFSWLVLVGVIALFILFVLWEWRHEAPFIDVKLLKNEPALSLVYLRTMATNYVLYLMLYGFPQWLESVHHFIPRDTGFMMLPLSVTAIGVGLVTSAYNKPVIQNFLGVFILTAACTGLYMLNVNSGIIFIIGFAIVMGMSDGTNIIANQNLLNAESPLEQKGVSFGLFRTFGYIGAILSGTQLKVLFHNGVKDNNFHQISYYALYSCGVLALLLIPLWLRRKKLKVS